MLEIYFCSRKRRRREKSDNDLEESVIGPCEEFFFCKEHSPVGVGGGGTLVSFDTYGFFIFPPLFFSSTRSCVRFFLLLLLLISRF